MKEVPDLDNVQPFFSDPILTDDLGNSESQGRRREETLTQNVRSIPYLFGAKPSISEMVLNEKVKRALATSYLFDPRASSTTTAQRYIAAPYHGLTKEEYGWIKENKFSLAAGAIKEKQDESDLAKQCLDWEKHWLTPEPYPNFNDINVDQEFDVFHETREDPKSSMIDQITTDHGQLLQSDSCQLEHTHDQIASNHGSVDRESMSTTWVTLAQGYHMIAGPLTSNSFHDSGVHMEYHFAEEANKESPPQSACIIPMEQVFGCDETTIGKPLEGTVEDSVAQYEHSKQPASDGGFETPYDLTGFASSVSDNSEREYSSSVSNDVEINEDECSVPHPEAMFSLVQTSNCEEFSASQQGITEEEDIDSVLNGYLHGTTLSLGLPLDNSPFNGGERLNYEAEAGNSTMVFEDDSSQVPISIPEFGQYNQYELSISDNASEPSAQLLGDLQAHGGASIFDSPPELQTYVGASSSENTANLQCYGGTSLSDAFAELPRHADQPALDSPTNLQAQACLSLLNDPSHNHFRQHGNHHLLHPVQANTARQEGSQNLIPEYDSNSNSENAGAPNHLAPGSPATPPGSAEAVQSQAFALDFDNPYDYRHYLSSDTVQSANGMNFDFPALSQRGVSNANQVNLANGNQVNFSNVESRETNSMLLQPPLRSRVPITNPLLSSPTTIPPSSPPALHSYPAVTPLAILRSNAPSNPTHFAPSTPKPVVMPNTDPATPCPAPKNKIQTGHMGTWSKKEHVDAEEAGGTNAAPEVPIKDVFGVQQKRRVGRPVGSKTNKKTADNSTKETPKPEVQAPKKRARKSTGDADSELKKARSTKKDTPKAAVDSSASTITADKPQTTKEAVKEQSTKHKQSPTSAAGDRPKTKRVRMPSRKSLEKKAADEGK